MKKIILTAAVAFVTIGMATAQSTETTTQSKASTETNTGAVKYQTVKPIKKAQVKAVPMKKGVVKQTAVKPQPATAPEKKKTTSTTSGQ